LLQAEKDNKLLSKALEGCKEQICGMQSAKNHQDGTKQLHEQLAQAEKEKKALATALTGCQEQILRMRPAPSIKEKQLQEELFQAEEENKLLSKALDECNEQIFDMQPAQEISDSEIKNQYEALFEAIGDWVDNQLSEADGLMAGLDIKAMPAVYIPMFRRAFPEDALPLAQVYPALEGFFAEAFVREFLQEKMFLPSKRMVGLPNPMETTMDILEEALGKLHKRDVRTHSLTKTLLMI
jgi:hypothetical protein